MNKYRKLKLSKIDYIRKGCRNSIMKRDIAPLLRTYEIIIDSGKESKGEKATLFTCDSFCGPHYENQRAMYKKLEGIYEEVNVIDMPILHYLTCIPDLDRLRLVKKTSHLLEINEKLIEMTQKDKTHWKRVHNTV